MLEKLLRIDKIKKYPEDTDLLEDVIVENKQAMEMTSIYNGILSGTMDTFASVISNNLNIVMKIFGNCYHCYVYSYHDRKFLWYERKSQRNAFCRKPIWFRYRAFLYFVIDFDRCLYI